MTDAVITWVDGNDPRHRQKRNMYLQKDQTLGVANESNGTADTRFTECGEVFYCIHLIRKNAPWIERIYLVTDDQRPHWLTESEAKRLDVTLVDHKVIFRDHEDVLPTFNSISIATVMHRIPGLAPEFIYFNDDVLVLRPTEKSDYFNNGRPIFRGHLKRRNFPWPFRKDKKWKPVGDPDPGIVGARFGRERIFRGKTQKLSLYHAAHPVQTQSYQKIMADRMATNIKFKFRHPEQFGAMTLYANLMLHKKACDVVRSDVAYFAPKIVPQLTEQSIRELVERDHIIHGCFQSLDEYDEASRSAAFAFLEKCVTL